MNTRTKKIAIVQGMSCVIVLSLFISTVAIMEHPSDYLPDRIARSDRKGEMYGYVFLPWSNIMSSGVAEEYMDLIAQCLDFCYVHAQWSLIGTDNNTLNENYLGNLTDFIRGLGARGVDVVIHIWTSSYTPTWMHQYTPELVGQKDRWPGIDPNTENQTALEHRKNLKNSMLHFQSQLCQYFINQGVGDHIRGFCLDDETSSDNWTDFFAELTDVIHSYNSSWQTQVMFNRIDKYHISKEAGLDVHAMDPYDQDVRLIQKIHYAYNVTGMDKISVLLDAMTDHENNAENKQMRRQAWISWFMGADSIGWYTFLYSTDTWACALNNWSVGEGPGITSKTQTVLSTANDIWNLNEAYEKISNQADLQLKEEWMDKLLEAYSAVKVNDFIRGTSLIAEVLEA